MNDEYTSLSHALRDWLEKALSAAEKALSAAEETATANRAQIDELKEALKALKARERADAPPAKRYVAVINTPGYLPEDDDPDAFDTAREAWEYLADQRQWAEDSALDAIDQDPTGQDPAVYSNTWRLLAQLGDAAAWLTRTDGESFVGWTLDLDSLFNTGRINVSAEGLGSVWGLTPGYDGDHDLGIAYSVMPAEPEEAEVGP